MPTTRRKPFANGVWERMHQTVANVMRTLVHTEPPSMLSNTNAMADGALAIALNAVQSNVSTVSGYFPAALAFRRDILLVVPNVVNYYGTQASW